VAVTNFKETTVFKKAFSLAMDIFEISRKFPAEEKYSMTDRIRRSSRSVCANLGEAYRKRRYPAHFVSKISDCDMESSETQVWLLFAHTCNYIKLEQYTSLLSHSEEAGRLLHHMIENPEKY